MIIKKILKTGLGIIMIILGVIGFFLPILPGWLMILIGICLIFPHKKEGFKKWIREKIKRKK